MYVMRMIDYKSQTYIIFSFSLFLFLSLFFSLCVLSSFPHYYSTLCLSLFLSLCVLSSPLAPLFSPSLSPLSLSHITSPFLFKSSYPCHQLSFVLISISFIFLLLSFLYFFIFYYFLFRLFNSLHFFLP